MKKKLFTGLAVSFMILSTGVLTSCEGNHKFNIDDYAYSLTSKYAKENLFFIEEKDTLSKMQTTQWTSFSQINENLLRVTTKSDYGSSYNAYTIFDIKNNRELYSGIDTYYTRYVDAGHNTATLYVLSSYANSTSNDLIYKIIDASGQKLIDIDLTAKEYGTIHYNSYSNDYYNDEDGNVFSAFTISYTNFNSKEQIFYYAYYNNKNIKKIDKNILERQKDDGYAVGDSLIINKTDIYSLEYNSNNKLKDFKYSKTGNNTDYVITFYEKDSKLGSVRVNNGGAIGFIDKYYYFYELTPVSSSSSKHNIEIQSGNSVIKANYSLYCYDFTSSRAKAKKVDLNGYVFMNTGSPLYNNKKDTFDKLSVSAYKIYGGVAIKSDLSNAYKLIIDNKANVCFDLTSSDLTSVMFKLGENRYLSGLNIINRDFDVVTKLPSNYTLWAEQELISCYDYSSQKRVLVDYDGIVRINPFSESCEYYKNAIVVGANENAKIYNRTNYMGVKITDFVSVSGTESIAIKSSLIIKTSTGSILSIYDLQGKLITKINSVSYSFSTVGNRLILTVEGSSTTSILYFY